jgi:hypothetical protein
MVAEQVGEPVGVGVNYDPGDSGVSSAVVDRGPPRKRCLSAPFDEKRKRRLGGCLIETCRPPHQYVSCRCRPRPRVNG